MALSVAITGGAGYLGRGILRQVARGKLDWKVTVVSRDEAKHIRVRERYPETRIVRADVAHDQEALTRIFAGHHVVIHAGASKLVDIGETAAWEVVRNNVVGSMNVARAAAQAGVYQCVFISSDKAVQPVNVYGMTKSVGERLWQEAAGWGKTEFVACRYGNVIGSTVSIATYFRDQLAAEGHIRITNPDMTRYYMGVDEAIELIEYTRHVALSGSVVIPRMRALSVRDFACIALGRNVEDLRAMVDTRVRIVGERPGEKLHESLLHEQESVRVMQVDDDHTPYWQLRPPGETHRKERFSFSSNDPTGGWMTQEDLKALLEDSLDV